MPFTTEYDKLQLIGKGSFAAVYKVRHKRLGYVRAIKISNEIVDNEDDKAYQSFVNECRLLLKIGNGCHPNIVHIYQPRLINSRALVEMDYVDGVTVNDYVKSQQGFVTMNEFWNFAEAITGAVGYCHADLYKFLMDPEIDNLELDPDDGTKFLISPEKERELRKRYCVNHNDLHSNNIMRRNYDGQYILLDFGLAIQNAQCVKSSARADGAYEYSSPEKLDGKEVTSESDVYSLGILMYEMLAGQVPFVMAPGGAMAEVNRIYQRQLHEQPAPIEPLRRAAFAKRYPGKQWSIDYPLALEQIIMKCLAKNPADRYSDAKKVYEALREVKMDDSRLNSNERERLNQLEEENEWLRAENGRLRKLIKEGSGSEIAIGRNYKGGVICYLDSTGQHGLLITGRSDRQLDWLRHIDSVDLQKMSAASQTWYKDNCFIVPPGSHIPNDLEFNRIMTNAAQLRLSGQAWINSPDSEGCARDLQSGAELNNPLSGLYLAVSEF